MSSLEHHVTGKEYWRSLEHLADAPEVLDAIGKEFPGYDADTIANTSRRRFMKIMGASMALAGLTLNGCRRWPREKLAPYSSSVRDRIPGIPEQYATAYELGGIASGLLVTSFDGRPIKVEGNPSHPASRTIKDKIGSADGFAQASVLELYDPERSRSVIDRHKGESEAKASTWQAFADAVAEHLGSAGGSSGDGFVILAESSNSPSLADMKKRLLAKFPRATWYEYEPITRDAELEGSRTVFGKALRPILHLDKATAVVLLDADPLGTHPAHVRYAADWADRRRAAANDPQHTSMSRVSVAESTFSVTGTVSDVRLPVAPGRIYPILRAIAQSLGVIAGEEKLLGAEEGFVAVAVKDLNKARPDGAAVVAVGPTAPAAAHALAHAINQRLGAFGRCVSFIEDPAGDRPSHMKGIADLSGRMLASQVEVLLIIGGNPVYDAPSDLLFGSWIGRVPLSAHLSLYDNETSQKCTWHLPRAHYLEAWSDARSWDGTATIVQPLIESLFGGRTPAEVLALLIGDTVNTGEQIVRRTWQQKDLIGGGSDFDHEFRKALESGVLDGSAGGEILPDVQAADFPAAPENPAGFVVRFDQDARVYDGRFANNGWLQEIGDPVAKLSWDNAAMLAKLDADSLGVKTNDVIRIDTAGGEINLPVYVLAGQPLGVIGVTLGYGRTRAGHIGDGLGFNTYSIRTSKAPFVAPVIKVENTGKTYTLALLQAHHIMDPVGTEGRDARIGPKNAGGRVLHETTFDEYKLDPHSALGSPRTVELQIFESPSRFNDTHAWGMAVDLSSCIGCNACAVACQAENNIPIVGKKQVLNHREMNWIRIDRYFKGTAEDPTVEVVYQPVMCQHCENAPCEQVCPVAATVHDSEGLNTMVYNRCIGTRYCSNNCPYKVRRFNYFDFHSQDPRGTFGKPYLNIPDQQQLEQVDPIHSMVFNPEVTVRMRGVMEKCTYCVQRIHKTVIAKRNNGGDVVDGDIVTACEQACPTQAIVFGNLNDPDSRVSQLQRDARAYSMLQEELNTRPRTRYLAKLRNPPRVEPESAHAPQALTVDLG